MPSLQFGSRPVVLIVRETPVSYGIPGLTAAGYNDGGISGLIAAGYNKSCRGITAAVHNTL